MSVAVVAIDGPAGTGKSTVALGVAIRIGGRYLDTGAMYRAATCAVLRSGVTGSEAVADAVARARIELSTDTGPQWVRVDGTDVTEEIRSGAVTAAVSAVSAVPAVRTLLIDQQRAIIAADGPIVVEGRDIASVVAPDAGVKVFLTAAPEVRAARRSQQAGATNVAAVALDIDRRDTVDSATNPLHAAPGAVEIDTTELTVDQVIARIVALVEGE